MINKEEFSRLILDFVEEIIDEDPIMWGRFHHTEEATKKLIVYSVIEQWEDLQDTSEELRNLTLLAVITKLLIDNFVLNLKEMYPEE